MNERHSRGKRKIGYLEVLFFFPDDFQPFFDAGVSDDFAYVYVGIVQEYVGVLVNVLDGVHEIVLHVFISMAAVDKANVNRGQTKGFVRREELVRPQLVMGYYILYSELLKMLEYLERFAPFVPSSDGFERAVFDQGIRGVHEGKHAAPVVLHSQSKTHHAETEPGADDQKMFGSERPGQAVVKKAKPQIEIIRFFVVTQWFGAVENVLQKSGIQAEIFQFVPLSK